MAESQQRTESPTQSQTQLSGTDDDDYDADEDDDDDDDDHNFQGARQPVYQHIGASVPHTYRSGRDTNLLCRLTQAVMQAVT